MMRDIDHPTMVKHGIGWGTMTGITSAQLAARGFTGIPSLLGLEEYHDWVADIGEHYIMAEGLAWKGFACCAWDHAAMNAAEQLMTAHSLQLEEIAHVLVEAPHTTVRLGTELPITTEESQFNLAWPLAALLVDGEVGPDQILAHRFADPQLRNLAARIEVVETEELNRLYELSSKGDPSGRFAAKVTISLKDGRVFDSGFVEGNINFPQRDWDEGRLEEKFHWLTEHVLNSKLIDELVDMIWRFEQVHDVRDLTRKLQ
jgi:2-methylcitrate dehydratase PrpD